MVKSLRKWMTAFVITTHNGPVVQTVVSLSEFNDNIGIVRVFVGGNTERITIMGPSSGTAAASVGGKPV